MTGRRVIAPEGLDQKQEIDRTAALVAALDAVVSAPTAVSWTSAALGIPTYKLLYNTRWMSFGQDYEPFAPSCRCIMPERSGDWAEVFTKAGQTLQAQFAV
jgi:ADP-heptose:LPS heptosyltransferase